MFTKEDIKKVNSYLKKHFDIIFNFEFNGLMLLCGESIIKLFLNKQLEVLSFVLLTHSKENIRDFLKANKINYEFNSEKLCYSFSYNNRFINIYFTHDLYYSGNLNTDHIFFDVKRKDFIPLGTKYALTYREVYVLYYEKECSKDKIREAKEFIQYMNHDDKPVKVKYAYNRLKALLVSPFRKHVQRVVNPSDLLNDKLREKIHKYIHEKFDIIYDYPFEGRVLVFGGTIRNLMFNKPVKDLDFVILTQDKCQVSDFIKTYKLDNSINRFGSPKITYNGTEVDVFSASDLAEANRYNVDMLLYDIHNNDFIVCGVFDSFETREIVPLKNVKNIEVVFYDGRRRKKLVNYVKTATKSKKRVKIVTNKIEDFYLFSTFAVKKVIQKLFRKLKNSNYTKCFQFLKDCRKEFCLSTLIGILMSLLITLVPFISGKMITSVMNKDFKLITLFTTLMLLVNLLVLITKFFSSKLHTLINSKMMFNIKKFVINNIESFETNNYSTSEKDVFAYKLNKAPAEIIQFFTCINEKMYHVICSIISLLLIYFINVKLALIISFFMIVIIYLKTPHIRRIISLKGKYFNNRRKLLGINCEKIVDDNERNSIMIKNNELKKQIQSYKTTDINQYRQQEYSNFHNILAKITEVLTIVVVMLIGCYLISHNTLEVYELIIIYLYTFVIFPLTENIIIVEAAYNNLNYSCNRIFRLIKKKIYNKIVYGTKYKKICDGKIEFSNVVHKYNSKVILDNCSFVIKPNQVNSFLMNNKEEKDNLLKLITRTYNATDGAIKIDEFMIEEYNEQFINDKISIVSPYTFILDGSIKDNLRLLNENVSDNRIIKICKEVCLDDFIVGLPNKYDTIIGDEGIKLTDDQKQLISIARALASDAKIIIFDLFDCCLSSEQKNNVMKVIDVIKDNHTILIVTDDCSVIKKCSNITLLEKGKIVGSGTHRSLLRKHDSYKKMFETKQ